MKKPRIKLAKREYVITAFASPFDGPGWANNAVKVVIRRNNGQIQEELIQGDELSPELIGLFAISNAVHCAMVNAVEKIITHTKKE